MSSLGRTLHSPLETLCIRSLHASPSVSVYDVRCRPQHGQRGPEERPLTHQIVFPRRGLFAFESRGEKLIADGNHVLFFNRDQAYRVAHPACGGDDCTVFAYDDRLLGDALELVDPRWVDTECSRGGPFSPSDTIGRPFRFVHGLNDERTFWAQEGLRRAAEAPHSASLSLDEAAVELLSAVLERCYRGRGLSASAIRSSTRSEHSELVQRTSLFLASAFGEKASLSDVASAVHASPFHLARLFRRKLGLTIHQYRHRLRLRAALTRVADGEKDLSALALELGFASHSHLTDAFRLAFGVPPAECRKSLNVRRLREMSKDLEALPQVKT